MNFKAIIYISYLSKRSVEMCQCNKINMRILPAVGVVERDVGRNTVGEEVGKDERIGLDIGLLDALRKVGPFIIFKIILLDSMGKEEVAVVDFSLSTLLVCCSLYIDNKQENRHENLYRV